jgi:hypothetical protein
MDSYTALLTKLATLTTPADIQAALLAADFRDAERAKTWILFEVLARTNAASK